MCIRPFALRGSAIMLWITRPVPWGLIFRCMLTLIEVLNPANATLPRRVVVLESPQVPPVLIPVQVTPRPPANPSTPDHTPGNLLMMPTFTS